MATSRGIQTLPNHSERCSLFWAFLSRLRKPQGMDVSKRTCFGLLPVAPLSEQGQQCFLCPLSAVGKVSCGPSAASASMATIGQKLSHVFPIRKQTFPELHRLASRIEPMPQSDSLLHLAGFAFAHAAWSVSDLPADELLVPLAIVERDGQHQLLRFEAETQEQAIREGKDTLARHESDLDAWVFVREGQVNESGGYVSVLTVEAKHPPTGDSILFLQRFQPFASGKFTLIGQPDVVVAGVMLSAEEVTPVLVRLLAGVEAHVQAAKLWGEWTTM